MNLMFPKVNGLNSYKISALMMKKAKSKFVLLVQIVLGDNSESPAIDSKGKPN
jgi:hypothetical protein